MWWALVEPDTYERTALHNTNCQLRDPEYLSFGRFYTDAARFTTLNGSTHTIAKNVNEAVFRYQCSATARNDDDQHLVTEKGCAFSMFGHHHFFSHVVDQLMAEIVDGG